MLKSLVSKPEPTLTMVQIQPDWTDPERRRWLLCLHEGHATERRPFESEQEARLQAFLVTGVGDFLAGVTWVRIPGLMSAA